MRHESILMTRKYAHLSPKNKTVSEGVLDGSARNTHIELLNPERAFREDEKSE